MNNSFRPLRRCAQAFSSRALAICLLTACAATWGSPASAAGAFVQGNTSGTFTGAQTAGNLNVVVFNMQGTCAVSGATDAAGNVYTAASFQTTLSGRTMMTFYAANILGAPAGNLVTIQFQSLKCSGNTVIAEYSGLAATNPLDAANSAVVALASGVWTSPSVTTSSAGETLVGIVIPAVSTAGNPVPGSGFTQRVLNTNTGTAGRILLEDGLSAAAGSYTATASPQSGTQSAQFHLLAFKASAAGDTTPPSTPTGLTATVISSTQINLSWTASTDNVGVTGYEVQRCTGASCTTFVAVGTPSGTTFNDTGLTASTTYRYQVRARDAVPNWSGTSSIVNATTQPAVDTQPPSVPTGLGATVISATQINLSWTASTDNVGVTGYEVQRCTGASCTTFAAVGTPSGTTFNDTGLSPSTTYRYQVRARDAVPNWSGTSTIVNATTQADTTAPSVPTGLSATVISSSQINLSWAASTDNVAVTGYEVQRCTGASCTTFAAVGTPSGTTFNNTGLTPGTTYRYQVRARDAVPNWSGTSTIVNATTQGDTTAPSVPSGLTTTVISPTQINLNWTASTDNIAVTGYQLQRCQGASCTTFADVALPTGTTFSDTGLSPSTTYRYQVRARDAVPNWSAYSSIAAGTTQADSAPPTAPSGLTANAVSSSQINLSWTASTDNVGVAQYRVERCQGAGCSTFSQIATPTGTSLSDTGLSASTTYVYRVRAADAVPNLSAFSGTASTTTQAPADTQAPTAPSGLFIINLSSGEIDLAWTSSTDNVGVTAYLVERCAGVGCSNFSQLATPAPANFNDVGLTNETSYSYRVRARDAANNLSPYSNTTTGVPSLYCP